MPGFQVVMIGMEKWYDQDALPLSAILRSTFGINHRHMKMCRDASKQTVLETLHKLDKPQTLLFYYSGHGSWDVQTQQFQMCTNTDWLKDSELSTALQSCGAEKVLIIVDACHAGGFDMNKEDPLPSVSTMLQSLSGGKGTAVLGACGQDSVTPGSSPLTTALRKILQAKKLAVLDPLTLKGQVQKEMQQATMSISNEFTNFMVSPGLTLVATCPFHECTAFGSQQSLHLGNGFFSMTTHGIPCAECHTAMRKESLHFDSCEYRIEHSYSVAGPSGDFDDIVITDEDSGFVCSSSKPTWPLTKTGYRYLNVTAH